MHLPRASSLVKPIRTITPHQHKQKVWKKCYTDLCTIALEYSSGSCTLNQLCSPLWKMVKYYKTSCQCKTIILQQITFFNTLVLDQDITPTLTTQSLWTAACILLFLLQHTKQLWELELWCAVLCTQPPPANSLIISKNNVASKHNHNIHGVCSQFLNISVRSKNAGRWGSNVKAKHLQRTAYSAETALCS